MMLLKMKQTGLRLFNGYFTESNREKSYTAIAIMIYLASKLSSYFGCINIFS